MIPDADRTGGGHHAQRASAPAYRALLWVGVALLSGCQQAPAPTPLGSLAPAPLPRAEEPGAGGALPIVALGEAPPPGATRLRLEAGAIAEQDPTLAAGGLPRGARVLLVPDGETYLAQVAPLLARLDDAGAEVWLAHPDGRYAYPLTLRDEADFQRWLDQPVPGRLRVIHRADGFELTTSIGKLPGPDSNGPSVPLRGGVQDLGRLRAGLEALRVRFDRPEELCWLPSFGMELDSVARALAATHAADGDALFARRCLVYPRPR